MRSLIIAAFALFSLNAASAAPAVKPTEAGFDVPALTLLKQAPPSTAFPNAAAYWLRDEETVTVHADGTGQEVHYLTARIYNSRGRGNADVSIPYNTTSQTVTDIHARTIRPDGQVLLVKPSDIHETSPYSQETMYDDAKSLGFSHPGVEDGAIVDYTYTVHIRKPIRAGQFADDWWFHGADPGKASVYTLIAPAAMPIHYRTPNGSPRLTVKAVNDGKTKIYRWEQRDYPDMTPESSMPPAETYLPYLEITTWPTWKSVSTWYQSLAASRMTATPETEAIVKTLIAGKKTDTEKAQAIFYWVEQKTRYVALELGLSAYQPHAAAEVCRNRYGDCKDMATLLVTMLRSAGINTAWPVLLQASNKLAVHDHLPAPSRFNHSIAYAEIDGKPYWFDSTAELCAFGDIPGSDRGVEALVIRNGGEWKTIPYGAPQDNQRVYVRQVALRADGSAEVDGQVSGNGDSALSNRASFRAIKPDQMRATFENMMSGYDAATLLHYSVSDPSDLYTPMKYQYACNAPLFAIRTGKLLVITDNMSMNGIADQEHRQYPLYIDGEQQIDYQEDIRLPSGYSVEAVPDNFTQNLPIGSIAVTYTSGKDVLTIHKIITIKPALVLPAEYPALRASLQETARHLKQPVILHPAS